MSTDITPESSPGRLAVVAAGWTARRSCLLVIVLFWLAALGAGLWAPEPMIGDEVTHFYLLVHQADLLPAPTLTAHIPWATGHVEKRHYPHSFLWHYVGAMLWKLWPSPFLVQLYQSLFYLQFMLVLWLLGRGKDDPDDRAPMLYVLLAASMPMVLLFGIAYYQDIPALAQLATAFFLLRTGRLWSSVAFMALALNMKDTVFPLVPAYGVCAWLWYGRTRHIGSAARLALAAFLLALSCLPTALVLKQHGFHYYPARAIEQYVTRTLEKVGLKHAATGKSPDAVQVRRAEKRPNPRLRIANNPGDVRQPVNILMYGGGLLWGVVGLAGMALLCRRSSTAARDAFRQSQAWFWIGLSGLVLTGIHLRTAPDIRFFLPGLIFLMLALARTAAEFPRRRLWMPVVLLVACLQGGVVLAQTYSLRHVPTGIREAVAFLKTHPPPDRRLFMYPEGHYRLFPQPHNWYLDYRLKDFWKADNDVRIGMLHEFHLGAIVIKKRRVGPIDPQMNDLGVYPDFFVRDIAGDPRFLQVFDNAEVTIYLVPQPTTTADES